MRVCRRKSTVSAVQGQAQREQAADAADGHHQRHRQHAGQRQPADRQAGQAAEAELPGHRHRRSRPGLTVFLVTHDLDTLYTICDRVAVLSQKKVLVVDTLERVAATDDAWVREYFHGPRGRAAHQAAAVPENH